MSLSYVYSPIQLYVQKYTRKHSYIKYRQTSFTIYFKYIYHQNSQTFVTTFIKNLQDF